MLLLHSWEGRGGGEEHGGMRDYANAWEWGDHTKTTTSSSTSCQLVCRTTLLGTVFEFQIIVLSLRSLPLGGQINIHCWKGFVIRIIICTATTTVNKTYLHDTNMQDTATITVGFLLGSITVLLVISSLLAFLQNHSFSYCSSSVLRHHHHACAICSGRSLLYSIVGLAIIFQYNLLSEVSMHTEQLKTQERHEIGSTT